MLSTGGRALHVYPPDYEGKKIEPSFTSILQAYYAPVERRDLVGGADQVHQLAPRPAVLYTP